ncbi:hypothetical protein acdb102_13900 [Acidothermaceae bacterium B102]|nr:hypothetical protein acdb102_13900 [Acidothermaceae bacterium B102]
MPHCAVFDHGVAQSRALGADVLAQLLGQVPARSGVWAEVSTEDREIMLVWLGLSRWPWIRKDRRHRAELALDTGAAAVNAMLHQHGEMGNTSFDGLNGPF